jgi:rRNA maturation RNase YbeY
MKIQINNNQKIRRLDHAAARKLTARLAKKARLRESPHSYECFSILFTDDAGIVPANQKLLDSIEVTDVICFGYDPIPGEEEGRTAEIIVNVERAVSEAGKQNRLDESGELALYLAHACNHLSGKDDKTARQKRAMRRTELAWLSELRREGLVSGLLSTGSA